MLREENEGDAAEKLIRKHQKEAQKSFVQFRESLVGDLDRDLKMLDQQMRKQLGNVCRKLQNRIRNNYSCGSLNVNIMGFYLEPYIMQEYNQVNKSIQNLKLKIFQYINNFSTNILEKNIQRLNDVSLFYFQNRIKHVYDEWYSVTSRAPLLKAEVTVSGLRRPETSWLVLGVCKKIKQYGPLKKGIKQQQFLGNVYLNGSQNLQGDYKIKKSLNEKDVFIIENINRMIYVYKKIQGRNIDQTFILDDNTDYYFYIALKGPLTIEFRGQ